MLRLKLSRKTGGAEAAVLTGARGAGDGASVQATISLAARGPGIGEAAHSPAGSPDSPAARDANTTSPSGDEHAVEAKLPTSTSPKRLCEDGAAGQPASKSPRHDSDDVHAERGPRSRCVSCDRTKCCLQVCSGSVFTALPACWVPMWLYCRLKRRLVTTHRRWWSRHLQCQK